MYIKTTYEINTFTRPSSKNPSKICSYKRKKTIYYLKCDCCGAEFTRFKGEMHEHRLKYKHVCSDCGYAGATKLGTEKYKQNMLKKIPIGTIKMYGEGKGTGSSAYPVIFIGYDNEHLFSKAGGRKSGGWALHHIYTMEKHLGRKIVKGEVVHHIDGDKTNNSLDNLVLMSVTEHNKCHAVSEEIVFILVKKGLVGFDRETNRYILN